MKYFVTEETPLLNALSYFFPDSSKSNLRSWLKSGRVYVDGKLEKCGNVFVERGQTISLTPRTRLVENHFPILYEDHHIVAIEKPEGLLSVSTAFEKNETAFAHLKTKYHPKTVYVVHRLDQDTSGVMLFALSTRAQTELKKTFEKHDLERKYVAIVEGHVEPRKGTWKSYLHEDAQYVVRTTSDTKKGELAISHFSVQGTSKLYSWLEVTLETGKKNQIRVHCQEAGHPVVGDKKYGAGPSPIKRLCLHAHSLSLPHPVTGKMMRFISPIPNSFYRLLRPNTISRK